METSTGDGLSEDDIVQWFCEVYRFGIVDHNRLESTNRRHPLVHILLALLKTPSYAFIKDTTTTIEYATKEIGKHKPLLEQWRCNPSSASKTELYVVAACLHSRLIDNSNNEEEVTNLLELSSQMGCYLAMNDLGYLLQDSNPKRSFELYEAAALIGNVPLAYVNLGYCYQEGIGVAKDESQCLTLYTNSGAVGLDNLATCYELGIGCSVDLVRAAELFKQSADLGVPNSMYNLSELYRKEGNGLLQSIEESVKYLDMAASLGHEEAIRKREKMFDDLLCMHVGCSCKTML